MVQGGYKVELSPRALRDLEQIVTFIAADNPPAAEKFGQQLIDQADAIGPHPFAGAVSCPSLVTRLFASEFSAPTESFTACMMRKSWLSSHAFGTLRVGNHKLAHHSEFNPGSGSEVI